MNTPIIAIHGGGDWYDASAQYVVMLNGAKVEEEKLAYENWYKNIYVERYTRLRGNLGELNFKDTNCPPYRDLVKFMKDRGTARETTPEELIICDDL